MLGLFGDASLLGSSPRMRGTPVTSVLALVPMGIIPAYAGNTALRFAVPSLFWDHPRVCGEHLIRNDCRISGRGSSPRMRGTHLRRPSPPTSIRIIPAYAGNTCRCRTRARPWRDHPRVCGEHSHPVVEFEQVEGSSPRMRGTRWVNGRSSAVAGIIPAYAGNTLYPTWFSPW